MTEPKRVQRKDWYYCKDTKEYLLFLGNKGLITKHPESFKFIKNNMITITDPKCKLFLFSKNAYFNVKVGKKNFFKVVAKSKENVTSIRYIHA